MGKKSKVLIAVCLSLFFVVFGALKLVARIYTPSPSEEAASGTYEANHALIIAKYNKERAAYIKSINGKELSGGKVANITSEQQQVLNQMNAELNTKLSKILNEASAKSK